LFLPPKTDLLCFHLSSALFAHLLLAPKVQTLTPIIYLFEHRDHFLTLSSQPQPPGALSNTLEPTTANTLETALCLLLQLSSVLP
jgi:hypothetical protein